jgi:antitoxin (DNA-binding transcriptional repressor) of toxin-antitoxin stability system
VTEAVLALQGFYTGVSGAKNHPETASQRERRDLRALGSGEVFVVTRNGIPVGELAPLRRREFIPAEAAVAMFAGAAEIDSGQFRADVDGELDQDPTPRA